MLKHSFLISILLIYGSFLCAAAPVIHVYFAELYFKRCKPTYSKSERESFLIGTLFPDIRYLAHVDRKKTHDKNVKLSSIIYEKDPFTAGKLFHTYVDEQREKIAQREKIYTHVKHIPKKTRFLKMVEDELCYFKMDRRKAIEALKNFNKGEELFEIPFYKIRAWHSYLRSYLEQSPLALFTTRSHTKRGYFNLGLAEVRELCTLMERYTQDNKVIAYVNKLVAEFEKKLVLH